MIQFFNKNIKIYLSIKILLFFHPLNIIYHLCEAEYHNDRPYSTSSAKISWYKDGQRIDPANHPILSSRVQIFGQYMEQLKINSVRPEDVGLYQCFLRTDTDEEFQAASELRLGGKKFLGSTLSKFN